MEIFARFFKNNFFVTSDFICSTDICDVVICSTQDTNPYNVYIKLRISRKTILCNGDICIVEKSESKCFFSCELLIFNQILDLTLVLPTRSG